MTTQELKQQIDKVLGNSIRCLLPSYWWKKLFYNVADTIDNSKEELEKIVIDSLDEFEKTHPSIASQTFYWTTDENSEEASKNKSLAIKTLMAMSSAIKSGKEYYNNPFYIAVPISFDKSSLADAKLIIFHQYYLDFNRQKISFPEVYIERECFDIEFDLYGDNGVPTTQPSNNSGSSVVVDSSLSETSTNPVQNKVITSSISKIAPIYFLNRPEKVKEYFETYINGLGMVNGIPRGFTLSKGAFVEVDTFDIVSESEFGVEYNSYDKRYREVFNKTSGELVRTEEITINNTVPIVETREELSNLGFDNIAAAKVVNPTSIRDLVLATVSNSNGVTSVYDGSVIKKLIFSSTAPTAPSVNSRNPYITLVNADTTYQVMVGFTYSGSTKKCVVMTNINGETNEMLLYNESGLLNNEAVSLVNNILSEHELMYARLDTSGLSKEETYTLFDTFVKSANEEFVSCVNGKINTIPSFKDISKNLKCKVNSITAGSIQLLPNTCIYMPNALTGDIFIEHCATVSEDGSDLVESRICFTPAYNVQIAFNGVAVKWANGEEPIFETGYTYEVSLFYHPDSNSVGPMGVYVAFK